jgi:hypothetical protein
LATAFVSQQNRPRVFLLAGPGLMILSRVRQTSQTPVTDNPSAVGGSKSRVNSDTPSRGEELVRIHPASTNQRHSARRDQAIGRMNPLEAGSVGH